MDNKLVSIITPCYNGEQCIHRLFDSIIAQTYRPLEFILVNDGSTDDTLSIVEEYKPKFAKAGIKFICYTQENRGLSGAIRRVAVDPSWYDGLSRACRCCHPRHTQA